MTQDDPKKMVEQLKKDIAQRLSEFGFQLVDTSEDNRQTRGMRTNEIYSACRQLIDGYQLALSREIPLPEQEDNEAWMYWYARVIDYWRYTMAEAVLNVGLQTALREALDDKEKELERQGCFSELDNPFE